MQDYCLVQAMTSRMITCVYTDWSVHKGLASRHLLYALDIGLAQPLSPSAG